VSTRATLLALLIGAAVLAWAVPARAWDDATGSLDMPWLGGGGPPPLGDRRGPGRQDGAARARLLERGASRSRRRARSGIPVSGTSECGRVTM